MILQLPVFITQEPEPIIFQKPVEPTPKEPQLYIVVYGDSLEEIASQHATSVPRLFSKNVSIIDPNRIEVGQELSIPLPDEVLTDRPLPSNIEVRGELKAHDSSPTGMGSFSSSRSGKSTPGWYYRGQCTAWVASKRFVPDGWGDASNWKNAATRSGWTVSSTPVVSAIGWRSGHVVYVEAIDGNRVKISEANYDYNGSVRTIWIDVSKYLYLY